MIYGSEREKFKISIGKYKIRKQGNTNNCHKNGAPSLCLTLLSITSMAVIHQHVAHFNECL